MKAVGVSKASDNDTRSVDPSRESKQCAGKPDCLIGAVSIMKASGLTEIVYIRPYDFTLGTDTTHPGVQCSGKVDCDKVSLRPDARDKAMGHIVVAPIKSCDLSLVIDRPRLRSYCAGYLDKM